MSKTPLENQFNSSGFKQMGSDDAFQFTCTNCCECCRNVRNAVMVEPLDLFRIAKYTYRSIEESVDEFTDPIVLTWGYPILTMKTNSFMDTCVFLKNSRCSIHEANPRACRVYPLIAGPDENDTNSIISFMDIKRNRSHFRGPTHRVKDWLEIYYTDEDRRFIRADYNFAGEFAKLSNRIDKNREDQVMHLMLLYRYFMYDLDADFNSQFIRNMSVLKYELKKYTPITARRMRNENFLYPYSFL